MNAAPPPVYIRISICMYAVPIILHMLPVFYNIYIRRGRSQVSLLLFLLVSLHLISDFEVEPVLKAHTAFTAFLHLHYVLLDIFEGFKRTFIALLADVQPYQNGK